MRPARIPPRRTAVRCALILDSAGIKEGRGAEGGVP